MQISINHSYIKQMLVAVLTSLCYFPINAESAMSSEEPNHNYRADVVGCLIPETSNCKNQRKQNPNSQLIPRYAQSKPDPTVPLDSSSIAHPLFQPTGTYDLFNLPNCGGICLYGNIKFVNESEPQAMIGIIWQLTSPQQTNTKIQNRLVNAQISKSEDQQNSIWMEKLVTAVRTKDCSGARGFAILLAPKLGKTPEKLLDEIRGCSTADNSTPIPFKPRN